MHPVREQGRTPLLYAVSSGFRNTAQLLVRRGSDVFAYDKKWVCTAAPHRLRVHRTTTCSLLGSLQSWSPLHWAARRGDCVLVRTLCAVGCNSLQRSVVRRYWDLAYTVSWPHSFMNTANACAMPSSAA